MNKIPTLTAFRRIVMWAIIGIAALAVLSFALYKLLAKPPPKYVTNISDSWAFQPPTGPAIGHLGGVPVFIPRAYANLMEYDGDPHFLEQRTEPPPQRSYQSGIASFAFDLDFPTMKVREFLGHSARTPEERMNLLNVGISSNSDYGSKGDDYAEHGLELSIYSGTTTQYEKINVQTYGLTGYAPIRANKKGDASDRVDIQDNNIYFLKNASNKTEVFITCSNSPRWWALCEMRFTLVPQMRVQVSIRFNKSLLPQWLEVKSSVSKVLLDFRLTPSQ